MGNNTFITNSSEKGKTLESRIQELTLVSKELKFLVGFFYFSGLQEFYETLKKLDEEGKLSKEHIKILVGLKVDYVNYGLYEVATKFDSRQDCVDSLLNSVRTAFQSSELDIKEINEQVDFFLKLLEEGKLVIRKTKDPNHSKLYLFKTTETSAPHLFITGSSNLTRAGLKNQNEFNVEIKDYGFEEAEKYFDHLWNQAGYLTDDDVKRLVETMRKETSLRDITPYEAYVYLLKTYIDIHQPKKLSKDLIDLMVEKGYNRYSFQLEAVSQAIANCETHGGTILADVVGLGKTVVACMVAKALGKRGVVIAPPHLVGAPDKSTGWKKYIEDFELYGWEIYSVGMLKDALDFVKNHENIEVVIVDEAHRFRNEKTQGYHYLREICRGKTVLLLTATPFNNKPDDIFALLKLFNTPKKSTIVFDEDLKSKFKKYQKDFEDFSNIKKNYNHADPKKVDEARKLYWERFHSSEIDINKVNEEIKKLAKNIRSILEPVVIRRNRLDLKHYPEKIDLPEVKDPVPWFYELTDDQSKFYDEVIHSFQEKDEGGRFKGAIYIPIEYEKGVRDDDKSDQENEESFSRESQRNLYNFMRRLLVKRFESSFGAFYESVKRFKKINETALNFIRKTNKFILDRDLLYELTEKEDDEVLEILEKYEKNLQEEIKDGKNAKKNSKMYDLNKFKYKNEFIKDIESDIQLFDEFLQKMDALKFLKKDAKAERLIEGIKQYLNERKVVIFTEYVDTAKHLEKILKDRFPDKVLPAFGNISDTVFKEIAENFDAQYKGQQDDRYWILLTTDKLSEGYNLNRAGVVINYDIPWNPVRVIQRVGRINRIGKKVYDDIHIINFFPTEKGSNEVKSMEIAQTKMFMIHKILGEDAKIFDPSEEPEASELYRRLNEFREDGEKSFLTQVKEEFENIKKKDPDILNEIQRMPQRVKTAKHAQKDELMVFIKKGKDLFVGYQDYSGNPPKVASFEEVFEKIKATRETKALKVSEKFWDYYPKLVDKKTYRKDSPTSQEKTILNKLETLKNQNLGELSSFVQSLIKDIIYYSSLSKYTLQQLANLPDDYHKNPDSLEKIKQKLEEIKQEVGEYFIQRTENQLKFLKIENQEIILAIENQKEI
jgi:superfamily II DNA or RNA helicase